MNGKEFLEDYDPQIKEVGYDNYSYTPEQVIERLEAFKKELLGVNSVKNIKGYLCQSKCPTDLHDKWFHCPADWFGKCFKCGKQLFVRQKSKL